jgi:hypothetical protein
MADFDAKRATIDIKITPNEQKMILEMRKPVAERIATLRAKAEAYRTYQQTLKAIAEGKS